MIDELIAIVRREAGLDDGALDADTPLVSSGIVDSFHLADVVRALESHYRVRIRLPEIGADNFDTPRQMQAFIQARRS